MSDFTICAYVRSDVGKVRNNNEDNYRIQEKFRSDVSKNNSELTVECTDDSALFSVCDGMGGEECGEIASLIAVRDIRSASCENWKDIVNEDVQKLNISVCDYAKENRVTRMGSTLSNLYIDKGKAIAVNVGDSRVYLFRNGNITRLTEDHDETTRLVKLGMLTEEQAKTDKRRHQLTQFLGMFEDEVVPEPHFSDEIALSNGDRFLLISDGVSDLIKDNELQDFLSKGMTPKETVNAIVDEALSRGGKDNTTAMVVDVTSDKAEAKEKSAKGKYVAVSLILVLLLIVLFLVGLLLFQQRNKPDEFEQEQIQETTEMLGGESTEETTEETAEEKEDVSVNGN